jgi:hypothetical protein
MVLGQWVARPSGDGIFKELYQTTLHVQPLNDGGSPDPQTILKPDPQHPIIIGMDPGSVFSAFSFMQWLPLGGKNKWVVFDELVTVKKRTEYERLIPVVMRRLAWWHKEIGNAPPAVWISDNSAFNQYRAAQGSYDVLEIERIYESHRARFNLPPMKIKPAPKFNGSIPARTRLLQKLLVDQEIVISSWCRWTQKMFLKIESKRQKPGDPLDPETYLTPQRSDYVHIFDALSYPILSASLSPTAVQPTNSSGQVMIQSAA